MPELDCFLRYRMFCNAEFYYVEKFPRIGIGHPSLQQGVGFKMVLFTASRGNTFVGGICALRSALLVCYMTDGLFIQRSSRILFLCYSKLWMAEAVMFSLSPVVPRSHANTEIFASHEYSVDFDEIWGTLHKGYRAEIRINITLMREALMHWPDWPNSNVATYFTVATRDFQHYCTAGDRQTNKQTNRQTNKRTLSLHKACFCGGNWQSASCSRWSQLTGDAAHFVDV